MIGCVWEMTGWVIEPRVNRLSPSVTWIIIQMIIGSDDNITGEDDNDIYWHDNDEDKDVNEDHENSDYVKDNDVKLC